MIHECQRRLCRPSHSDTHTYTLKEITFSVLITNVCSVSPTLGGGDLEKDPNHPGQVALQRLLKDSFPRGMRQRRHKLNFQPPVVFRSRGVHTQRCVPALARAVLTTKTLNALTPANTLRLGLSQRTPRPGLCDKCNNAHPSLGCVTSH